MSRTLLAPMVKMRKKTPHEGLFAERAITLGEFKEAVKSLSDDTLLFSQDAFIIGFDTSEDGKSIDLIRVFETRPSDYEIIN